MCRGRASTNLQLQMDPEGCFALLDFAHMTHTRVLRLVSVTRDMAKMHMLLTLTNGADKRPGKKLST